MDRYIGSVAQRPRLRPDAKRSHAPVLGEFYLSYRLLLLCIYRCGSIDGSSQLLLQPKVVAVVPNLSDLPVWAESEDVYPAKLGAAAGWLDATPRSTVCSVCSVCSRCRPTRRHDIPSATRRSTRQCRVGIGETARAICA